MAAEVCRKSRGAVGGDRNTGQAQESLLFRYCGCVVRGRQQRLYFDDSGDLAGDGHGARAAHGLQVLLGAVGARLGVLDQRLGLAVFVQGQVGNILSLLDLALVGLDPDVELVVEGDELHQLLAVLLGLHHQLLVEALGLPLPSHGLTHAALLRLQLGLQVTQAGLQLGHHALALALGEGLGLLQAHGDLADLDLQLLAQRLGVLVVVLLLSELVGQTGVLAGQAGGGLLGGGLGVQGVLQVAPTWRPGCGRRTRRSRTSDGPPSA